MPLEMLICIKFFRASLVAQTVKRLPAVRETWVRSLCWEDSLEKEMANHSSIPGESHGHGIAKSRTRLSDFTFKNLQ